MEQIYNALGWQGGTVHQIVDEIKRLKKIESKFDLLVKKLNICEPASGFELSDLNNEKNCDFCLINEICHFVAGNLDV